MQVLLRAHSSYPVSYLASSTAYVPISPDYELNKVIVMHRHGDRSQITRSLGPSYPESNDLAKIWTTKLPSQLAMREMLTSAHVDTEETDIAVVSQLYLFNGWDKEHIPYGQLTHLGYQQLKSVGKTLQDRYKVPLKLPNVISAYQSRLLLRSTNSCRTVQSLRSLLCGFLGTDKENNLPRPSPSSLPFIRAKPKAKETMFPGASGPSVAMASRRSIIHSQYALNEIIPDFNDFEIRMKNILGYDDKVQWLTIKEILTCHMVHDIPFPEGITIEDEQFSTMLNSRLWGLLYKDDIMNRYAIGRFLKEFSDDLKFALREETLHDNAVSDDDNAELKTRIDDDISMLIYSGHDSTLVPVLCALGIYDDIWPPYASYLCFEIATHKTSKKRFVRALYNDQEVSMLNSGNIWLPLDDFFNRLSDLSISAEEYERAAIGRGEEDDESLAKAVKAYQQEIQATLAAPSKNASNEMK